MGSWVTLSGQQQSSVLPRCPPAEGAELTLGPLIEVIGEPLDELAVMAVAADAVVGTAAR